MRNLFLPGVNLTQSNLTIDGPDAHHLINVLRIRVGESITLLDNMGGASLAEITELGKKSVSVRVVRPLQPPSIPTVVITVAQALGKGDKFEQVIQHATEIGASAFIPLLTERTVVKVDARDSESKIARWSLIAKGASEQSGRATIPEVLPVISLKQLCGRFGEFDSVLLLHPPDDVAGSRPTPPAQNERVLILIGPEGGFSPSEVELAERAGAVKTSLSPFTLRTETAALVAVSQLLHDSGGV
jgi:16S rRNA (uracil1498-N3)-methyltransferase